MTEFDRSDAEIRQMLQLLSDERSNRHRYDLNTNDLKQALCEALLGPENHRGRADVEAICARYLGSVITGNWTTTDAWGTEYPNEAKVADHTLPVQAAAALLQWARRER